MTERPHLRSFVVAAAATLLFLVMCLPSCGTKEPGNGDGESVKIGAQDRELADKQFNTLCATCHGASGKGDGAAAAKMDPKPRDWTDEKWQAETTDEELTKVIRDGGQLVGLSPLMTANVEHKDKPGVIAALVEKVRSFRK